MKSENNPMLCFTELNNSYWSAAGVRLFIAGDDAGERVSSGSVEVLNTLCKHKSSPWAAKSCWLPAKYQTHKLRKTIWIT